MFLIKCSCGCHFTMKDEAFLQATSVTCLNCRKGFDKSANERMDELGRIILKSGMEVYRLPGDVEFRFTMTSKS